MTRNGRPISEHPLKHKVNAGISYNMAYLETSACIAAGLDLMLWDTNVYPLQLKERVCAWFKKSGEIATHIQDAKARAQEKAAKRK